MAKQKQLQEPVKVGTDTKGKPVYAYAEGSTREQVHDAIVDIYREYGLIPQAAPPAPKTPRFRDYAKKWYTTYKQPLFAETTERARTSMMQTHVYAAFKNKRLHEISPDDVQQLYNSKAEKGMAKSTLRLVQIFVNGTLDAAVYDGLIPRNPARDKRIKLPGAAPKTREPLTEKQATVIINDITQRLEGREQLYLALLAFTGMRRGEVLGLKWDDVDFDGGAGETNYIHVRREVAYPSNTPQVKPPKTAAGIRTIPIVPPLMDILKRHRGIGWMFTDGFDRPLHEQFYRKMWKSIRAKVELYGATPHVFRHTFVTLAALYNIPPVTVQALAGHANIQTTLAIYTHVQEAHLRKAGTQMRQMFGC